MIIDEMDLEFCSTIEEVLQLCLNPLKKLLTNGEQEEIKSLASNDKELKTMLDDYLTYFLTISAKACILHVFPRSYTYDEAFLLVANYYVVVIEYATILVRQSLLSNSLAQNGNSSIKSISSNGRSVTFMTSSEVSEQSELPQSLKDRLPLPQGKAKVRVW